MQPTSGQVHSLARAHTHLHAADFRPFTLCFRLDDSNAYLLWLFNCTIGEFHDLRPISISAVAVAPSSHFNVFVRFVRFVHFIRCCTRFCALHANEWNSWQPKRFPFLLHFDLCAFTPTLNSHSFSLRSANPLWTAPAQRQSEPNEFATGAICRSLALPTFA